jgi:hypothetical protein
MGYVVRVRLHQIGFKLAVSAVLLSLILGSSGCLNFNATDLNMTELVETPVVAAKASAPKVGISSLKFIQATNNSSGHAYIDSTVSFKLEGPGLGEPIGETKSTSASFKLVGGSYGY